MYSAERPGEGTLAAEGFLRGLGGAEAPAAGLSPESVGALHLAVYDTLTRVFGRYDSLVSAGRELFLVAAVATAVLLWRTARRLGLTDPASAAAVVLAGVPALLPPVALFDVPAALAAPWLLLTGFLTASGRPTRAARIGAVLCGALATLLAPVVALLALAAAAAALALRPRSRTAALLLGAALLVVAVLLRRWEPVATAAVGSLPVGAVTGGAVVFLAVGALAAWLLPAPRAPAIALVAATAATFSSPLLLDVLVVGLPMAAVLAGALLQELLHSPAGAHVRIGAVLALGGLCVAGVLSWPAADARPTGRTPAALLGWAAAELPEGARLLAPDRLRADLLHAGADPDQVLPPGTVDPADASAPVLVLSDGGLPGGATVLARFDGGEQARTVVVVDPAPGVPTPEELQRRRSLAAAILANPRTSTGDRAGRVLRSAAVDQRLLSLLAALTAWSGVGIAEFPAPQAEPDGLLARRVLLDAVGEEALRPGAVATDRLVGWLEAQRGPFAPDSVEVTDQGVLVGFRYVSAPDALVTRSAP